MILTAIAAAAAFSADCPPANGTAVARSYRVLPGTRVTFYRRPDCADASCSEGAYVVAGDRVVVFQRSGTRVCALFDRTRETTGWIDAARLAPDTAAARPPVSAWTGDWYDGDDHIRLTAAAGGRLRVEGDAYWPSKDPADRESGPNIGDLDGVFRVKADRLDYADDGDPSLACRAVLRLVGSYLLVDDNGNCGGMNVRFTGTYRRRAAHRPATRS